MKDLKIEDMILKRIEEKIKRIGIRRKGNIILKG
jgi:hypothetical protein